MKKLMLLAAGIVASIALVAGCATATVTPATIAATLCTPVKTAESTITALVATDPTNATLAAAAAALKKAQPTIDASCSAASIVTSDDVQTLITVGLPALGTILGTLPLPAATLTTIETDFALAEAAVNIVDVVVTNIKAAQIVAAVMAPATPLSAAVFK